MFTPEDSGDPKSYRSAMVGLALLSTAALAITIWIMVDFLDEQSIVEELRSQLPPSAQASANYLVGELRWQFRLITLVVINLVATTLALVLLWRAYRASQASLQDVQVLAKNILGSMEQAVVTTDKDGNVTSINGRASELLDADPKSVGRPVQELTATIPLNELRDRWIRQEDQDSNQEFAVDERGIRRTLRASCQTLRDRGGNEMGNVLQVRDITSQRLVEDQMRRMERYIGLGSLAGGLHHEIKNPLAALSLHVQLLEEELSNADIAGDVDAMLSVIRSEVTRIGGVLEAFRDFASIDALNLEPIDLNDLVSRQMNLIKPKAESQDVAFESVTAREGAMVDADQVRLEQVLLNLMVNALEAMPSGGKLRVSTATSGTSAVIEVRDTGQGIPSALHDKILDPYFTTKSSGTGLGLAFCDKIVRQHFGSLDFETSEKGTVFRLTFPIKT